MPNGKPGDHPRTDIFVHGLHPFPADIEAMIRELHSINPSLLEQIDTQMLLWESGKEYEVARKELQELIERSKFTST